jgi:hypothetical protein
MTAGVFVLVAVLAQAVAPTAPAPANGTPAPEDAPTLTEVQRLQIQNLAQRIELAQLRAQAAQREFDTAREQIQKLVSSLQVDGYTLNLETLSYTPTPAPAVNQAPPEPAPPANGKPPAKKGGH